MTVLLLTGIYLHYLVNLVKDACQSLPCYERQRSRITPISYYISYSLSEQKIEQLAQHTKAESDRFGGCGIKPGGSGAGEIVPAGRDQRRKDKAHSNSLVDVH